MRISDATRDVAAGLLWVVLCQAAVAQIPLLGRYQDFAYPAEEVQAQGQRSYDELLTDLRAKGELDEEPALRERIRSIADGLIAKAIELKPSARTWRWELHTSGQPRDSALSLAGGKLLFGSTYIEHLDLDDAELATLIAHEVAHTLAEHQREVLSQVFYLNSGSLPISAATAMARFDSDLSLQIHLATLLKIQESEADQLGMILAHRAGWPATGMISFYQKLVTADAPTFQTWAHPSRASRLNMAQILGSIFDIGTEHGAPASKPDAAVIAGQR